MRASARAQLHPMQLFDGRYPPGFNYPMLLHDFLHMGESALDRILMAYHLGSGRRRYYGGSYYDEFDDDDFFYMTRKERIRNLIVLFEYLGAYRLSDYLRYRRY